MSPAEVGCSRNVPLTRGYVAFVDNDDYERVMAAGRWSASVGAGSVTAVHGGHRNGRNWTEGMHNFITGWTRVNHINGNRLDNRRENLREASHRESIRSSKLRADNTSGYKGVSWNKNARKWTASIYVNGQARYLGLFVEDTAAALAYDLAALEHFGEFAAVNFPSSQTGRAHALGVER